MTNPYEIIRQLKIREELFGTDTIVRIYEKDVIKLNNPVVSSYFDELKETVETCKSKRKQNEVKKFTKVKPRNKVTF